MFTRGDWCRSVLLSIGNALPNSDIMDFMVGWTCFETATNSGATFNLLNTELDWPGATIFNAVGVKNYATYTDGIDATVATLKNGFYPDILAMLQSNVYALNESILAELKTWSGGTAYGSSFALTGHLHWADLFTYGSAPTPPIVNAGPTPNQRKAGVDQWLAPWLSMKQPSPPTGTGIFDLWMRYMIAGHNLGSPVSWEYTTIDWNGDTIIAQEFARARCEWAIKDGTGTFRDKDGIISL